MDDVILDKQYWENQYRNNNIGWDIGYASPPLVDIINNIEYKNGSILIPGAGNAYEAEYLLEKGFTNITIIDISPTVIKNLQLKYHDNKNIHLKEANFFEINGKYDFILEQTFFCALSPILRPKYVEKMIELLKPNGILTGVLFNRTFEKSPPFGGSIQEYIKLFENYFEIVSIKNCKNSILPRANSEIIFKFRKKTILIDV